MTIEKHKRTLGAIHLVYGILVALGFLFLRSLVAIVAPFIEQALAEESASAELTFSAISSIIYLVFTFIFIVTTLPSLIGGIALLRNKNWGIYLCTISGVLSLPSFPFGTGIGIYTIYVLVKSNRAK